MMNFIAILMGIQIISSIKYDCIALHCIALYCIVAWRDTTKRGEVWHGPYDITKSLQSPLQDALLFFRTVSTGLCNIIEIMADEL